MKHKVFIVLAVFISTAAIAQTTKKLSLQEAIELSVKNSGQLKGAEAKIEEATAALKEAIERKLPDANASASYLRLSHANVDLKTKSNSSGGSGGTPQESPNISQVMYGMLNVSMPIYAGGRIKYGIEAAQYLEQAAKLDAQSQQPEIELNAINAYTSLFKAGSVVNLVKENLQTSQQRVKDLTNLEQNGLLARNDLMKAQLQQSNIELALLDAENNWKLATVSLNLLMGLPENTVLEVDSVSFTTVPVLKTIDEYEQAALQGRKEIDALNFRSKAAGVNIKAIQAEKLPSVAVTGGYIAANIPNFVTVTNAVNIGVGVQYSLSSLWKNKSKVDQAKARQKQIQVSMGILNDNIHLEINRAYQNYLLTQKKNEVYQKAIDQATENYRIVKNKFDNSLATTTDVLDADLALLQAKINYTNAKADAVLAYNQLLQSAGLLNNTK